VSTASPALAALQRAAACFDAAGDALRRADFEAMHAQLHQGLDGLAALACAGQAPQRAGPAAAAWDGAAMERQVWDLLARLKEAGCPVFAFAGTLLGLERDGRLLPNDKDADFAVWLEDFAPACRALQALGFTPVGNAPPFSNVASLHAPATGLSLDLFGIRRDARRRRLEGGAWVYGRPASHQRITHYPWLELAPREGPAGPVWWPEPAEGLLAALYGDWRSPQPEWDSLVSCLAVQETNLQWRCWALKSLGERWLAGDLGRARRLVDQIERRAGLDAPLRAWRGALDTALAIAGGWRP